VIRLRYAVPAACALVLALAGCKDPRRDVARAYLQTHPPAGFAVVAVPETVPVSTKPDGSGEAVVSVRYRLAAPTVEVHGGFTLPRGQKAVERLTAIRGWALSTLPDGQPLRETILATVAQARADLPVKRIVTPAGTELDAIATVTLRRTGANWEVVEFHTDASVPGAPDSDARIPLEDSPEVSARFDQLEATARQLEQSREEYLAARQRAAAASREQLRDQLRAGQTFEGHLPDSSPLRIIISKGIEGDEPPVAVLTVRGAEESSARFTGTLVQQPAGNYVWRSARILTLSVPSLMATPAATDASAHPILTLFPTSRGLAGQLEMGAAQRPVSLDLRPTAPVDLIPDVPSLPAADR
jgi:hypothetical protein